MPKGYIIFTLAIRDRAGLDSYIEKAVPTIMQHGGRPIAVDDNAECVEGNWHGDRTVVLEFDSVEAPRRWYNSSEYQPVKRLGHAATERSVAIVSGFEMPGG